MLLRLPNLINNVNTRISRRTLGVYFQPSLYQLKGHLCNTISYVCIRYLRSSLVYRQSHYELLGISEFANQEQIKAAYFKKSRDCHPDWHPRDKVKHDTFVKLNEAYTTLLDPTTRKDYDFKLHSTPDHYITSYPPHYWRNNFQGYNSQQSYAKPPKIFKTKNYIVVLWLCGISLVGVIIHYFIATVGGEIIRKRKEDNNNRIVALHKEITDTARKNGPHKQLQLFLEQHRQDAIIRKDAEAEKMAVSLLEKVKREKTLKKDQDQ